MNIVAKALLTTKSVHLEPNPDHYFTWTSGRRSPIYCDNRQLISHPAYRSEIVDAFCDLIKENYPNVELIAGTATAGIPWAAWISEKLILPMVYIRSKPKGHGLKTAIEGYLKPKQNVLIIEDLISTGKSSLEALEHCQAAQLNTLAVISIFTYAFKDAQKNFKDHGIEYKSLCDVDSLLNFAVESQKITSDQAQSILAWRDSF